MEQICKKQREQKDQTKQTQSNISLQSEQFESERVVHMFYTRYLCILNRISWEIRQNDDNHQFQKHKVLQMNRLYAD